MTIEPNRAAFLGLRLRVVQQLIDQQGREVLNFCKIEVPPVCVSVFVQIAKLDKANVTEIVEMMKLSRQTVLQRLKLLESRNLISSAPGITDRRYRILCLSPNGQRELKKLEVLLGSLDEVFEELGREVGVNLTELFGLTENALQQKSLLERLTSAEALQANSLRSRLSENV